MKNILSTYCPNIVLIIGDKHKYWQDVNSKYLERLSFIKNEVKEHQSVTIRRSIIDNIIESRKQKEPKEFLSDIDTKVKFINSKIENNKNLVDKLKRILQELIIPEKEESKSYDRVAEIYSIHYLLNLEVFQIVDMEYQLSNGKCIDCLIKEKSTGAHLLLDFVSIYADSSKIESDEKLVKLLAHRISRKYMKKTENLDSLPYNFRIFPIVWTEQHIINKYYDVFCNTSTEFSEEIFSLIGIQNITEDKYYYKFGPISKI